MLVKLGVPKNKKVYRYDYHVKNLITVMIAFPLCTEVTNIFSSNLPLLVESKQYYLSFSQTYYDREFILHLCHKMFVIVYRNRKLCYCHQGVSQT